MKKFIRLLICLLFILTLEQAMAVVNMRVISGSRIALTPGVDLVRQTVSNLVIDADQPYTVQLSDQNGGILVMGYHSIPYRVSYNDNIEVKLGANPTIVESAPSVTNGNRTIAVTVLGTDTARAAAGDYHSTMVLTITAF